MDYKDIPVEDRPPVHVHVQCHGASARIKFMQGGEEVFFLTTTKVGARRLGEILLKASAMLEIAL